MSLSNNFLNSIRRNKVTISSVIKKDFPFFHGLRDKGIITEEIFTTCLDTAKTDFPKAIYDVLEIIDLKESTVKEIFCQENLDSYPDLQKLYQSVANELKGIQSPSQSNVQTMEISGESKGTGKPPPSQSDTRQKKKSLKKDRSNFALQFRKLMTYSPKLPVDCAKMTGTLYKEKYWKGIKEKCIEDDKGNWYSLQEFAAKGQRKHWRKSIRCGEWNLAGLIKDGILPNL